MKVEIYTVGEFNSPNSLPAREMEQSNLSHRGYIWAIEDMSHAIDRHAYGCIKGLGGGGGSVTTKVSCNPGELIQFHICIHLFNMTSAPFLMLNFF